MTPDSDGAHPFGSIGGVPIDPRFLRSLQFVSPEFAFTADPQRFSRALVKSYAVTRARAEEARRAGLDRDPAVKADLDAILRLTADRYLAGALAERITKNTKATDDEARAFYRDNAARFATPGRCSYLEARVKNPTPEILKSVQDKMASYARIADTLDQFKMSNADYGLTFERDQATQPGSTSPLAVLLAKARPGRVEGPVTVGSDAILVLVVARTEGTVRPFDEVREECRGNAANEKVNRENQRILQRAVDDYPIQLDPSQFGDAPPVQPATNMGR